MRLWLSKNSDVPLREQLVRQVMLGVVSDDLKPGQRLPSTRELARRFRIHSNTVSAAYRDLERAGWLEMRKGSGVYVRQLGGDVQQGDAPLDSRLELDRLISAFFTLAAWLHFTSASSSLFSFKSVRPSRTSARGSSCRRALHRRRHIAGRFASPRRRAAGAARRHQRLALDQNRGRWRRRTHRCLGEK